MPPPELVVTGDGSHTLRTSSPALPEARVTYHSRHGAVQESRHIFVNQGLHPLIEAGYSTIQVLELGFGTGLNALLFHAEAQRFPQLSVHYTTFEPHPIDPSLAARLNFTDVLGADAGAMLNLHALPWATTHQLGANFTFTKYQRDFRTAGGSADLLLYDAFAPEDQPELWTVDALRFAHERLSPGGRLLTYCAQGQFKRNLRSVGFRVEGLPGPPGKREITRAIHQS